MIADHLLAVVSLALFTVVASRGRRRAILGAASIALGGTALRVALGTANPWSPHAAALRALPPLSVGIDAALELFGALLAASAALAAMRSGSLRSLVAGLLAAGAALLAGWSGGRHAAVVGFVGPIVLASIGAIAAAGVARLTQRNGEDLARPRGAEPSGIPFSRWMLATGAITGLALVASHVVVVLVAAATLSLIASAMAASNATRRRVPWLPVVAIPPLAVAAYLIVTIAASTGLSIRALPDGPFSPAAESLLVPLLGLASLGFFGMRPLERIAPRSVLALGGAAILLRVAGTAFPGGVAAWETVAIPLGVVSIGIAALARDALAAAAGMAWIACFSSGGVAGAWWLAAAVSAASVLERAEGALTPAARTAAVAAAAASAAYGAVLGLDAVLRTETFYGLLAWIALTAAAFRGVAPQRD